MPDGQVVFEITGDNKGIRRSLSETTGAIERETRKWDQETGKTAGSMEEKMAGMFKKISVAATAATVAKTLYEWGKAAVSAASDLAEVQNVVDVTFGESASQIDTWAKKAQTQFGLTETQAKKFTSTLGAMMKSAGLAGPEIVTMSEDMAGLAADMASFYNLDFETAFQKIRSGIAGETEPLKQLGINMSVANLEAYALTQGITKAFDEMSQGEQTVLRYQYLMQATADAQGDFARTSNGYANSVRRIETAWNTISTTLGSVLMNRVTPLAETFADLLGSLTAQPETTVLDTFNDIDLNTASKLAEIERTANEANALVKVLEDISAHAVKTGENARLEAFISVLAGDITGLGDALIKAQNEDVEGSLESLASALTKSLGGEPGAWETLLTSIIDHLGSVTAAVGEDNGQTKDWLREAAAAADDLGPEYAGYWENLLTALGDDAGATISALAGGGAAGNNLAGIAGGANSLGALAGAKWSAFIGAIGGLDGKDSVPKNLQGVASALASGLGGSAAQWETLLTAVGTKLPTVTAAVGDDNGQTKAWLEAAAEAADDLGSDYSALWANLLAALGDNAGDAINALTGGVTAGEALNSLAGGANELGLLAGEKWDAFIGAINGLENKESVPKNLQGVADALSKGLGGNASQWETLLTAISTKLPAVTGAVGADGTKTKDWLAAAADVADNLGGDYSGLWENLLAALGDNAGAAINALTGGEDAGKAMAEIAKGGNDLGMTTGGKWASFIGALQGLDNKDSIPQNLKGVADALATNLGGTSSQWEILLASMSAYLPTISKAVANSDGANAGSWMEQLAAHADDLGSDYSTLWATLLKALGDHADDAIAALSGGDTAGGTLASIASGANQLGLADGVKWSAFIGAISGLENMDSVPANLQGVANALATSLGDSPAKWETLLTALSANLGTIASATGSDTSTAPFLSQAAAAAAKLGSDYSGLWSKLLSALGENAGAAVQALAGGDTAGGNLASIASGANQLGLAAGTKWSLFAAALQGVVKEKNIPATLSGIAAALAKNFGGSAEQWSTILLAVGGNLPPMTQAVTQDGSLSKTWLSDVAAAADDLGGDYSTLWTNLLTALGNNAAAAVMALSGGTTTGSAMQRMAMGANMLGNNAPSLWESLLGSLQKANALTNIFGNGNAAANVEELAKALSGNSPDTTKAAAWQTFLSTLNENAPALSTLTQTPVEETKQWLSDLAGAANTLNPENAAGWSLLMGSFVTGLPGLKDTKEGQAFFQLMAQEFLAMGQESEEAKAGLLALGMSTVDIDSAQRDWLETCKRLVKTIPGLSSVINMQTGAVTGGTSAINAYIEQYRKYNEIVEVYDRHKRKGQAIADEFADIDQLKYEVMVLDKMSASEQTEYANIVNRLGQLAQQYTANPAGLLFDAEYNRLKARKDELDNSYYGQYVAKLKELETRQEAYASAVDEHNKEGEALAAIYGTEEEALKNYNQQMDEARKEMTLLERAAAGDAAAMQDVQDAVQGAVDALTALADYQEQIREETARSVEGVIKGFEQIETPAQKATREMKNFEQALANAKTPEEIEKINQQMNELGGSTPSVQNMTEALESQLKFMEDYLTELDQAKKNGVDESLLASLSDGSQESFDYLYALNHSGGDIQKLNERYREVQKRREEFTDTLTDEKLKVDETYEALAQKASETVNALSLGDEAYKSVADTCASISAALADSQPAIASQVDSILAILARLTEAEFGANVLINTRQSDGSYAWRFRFRQGSNANGLEYVPYDGYLAYLHQGERVQTAAEAELSRRYSLQQPGMDAGSLGGAIGANIGSMQIIWHGRVVADILSEMQGDQYRALERSKWRS